MPRFKKSFLFVFTVSFFCVSASLAAQNSIPFHSVSWRYTVQDAVNYSLRSVDESSWKTFPSETRVYTADTKVLWLRGRLFLASPQKKTALLLEKVCGIEQIYLNGRLLNSRPQNGRPLHSKKSNTRFYSRCGRSAVHSIPFSLLERGGRENIIAIRLIKSSAFRPPSLAGRLAVLPLESAELYLWKKNLFGFSYSFLSLFLAVFFLVIYLRFYRVQEYYAFSIFLFVYAVYKFTQNEILYSILDLAPLYERLEQACFILLPPLFYLFYISFFRMKRIQFSLGPYNIDRNADNVGNLYLFGGSIIAMLSAVYPEFTKYIKGNTIWLALQVPVFAYYILTALQNFKISLRAGLSFLAGSVFLLFAVLYGSLGTKETGSFPSEAGGGSFLFQLSISIGLLYGIILRRIEVEKHRTYLKSIDEVQHRIFAYITSILIKPSQKVIENIQSFWEKKKNKTFLREEAANAVKSIEEIQANLKALTELASLEVLAEPEHTEEINLKKFTRAVCANAKITAHIRVDSEAKIKTNLNLMNTAMVYVMQFLSQQNFRNVDLVVTARGEENILFHFLAFHSDSDLMREIYRVCTHISPLRDPRWIKWSIISEIIRVLQGKITLSIVRRRFLRIGVALPSSLNGSESGQSRVKTDANKQEISLILHSISSPSGTSSGTGSGAGSAAPAGSGTGTKTFQKKGNAALPRFSFNMSMREVISLIKMKWFVKKNKRR